MQMARLRALGRSDLLRRFESPSQPYMTNKFCHRCNRWYPDWDYCHGHPDRICIQNLEWDCMHLEFHANKLELALLRDLLRKRQRKQSPGLPGGGQL